MSTLYQILGLRQSATQQELKAAFRALARRLHPDVNAGDPITEHRFKELNNAYRTLTDPISRSAYDRALVCERKAFQHRFLGLAAIATASFVLTAVTFLLAVLWSRQSGVPQALGADRRQQTPTEARAGNAAPVMSLMQARSRGWSWTTYRNDRFRFSLKYPVDVFAFIEGPANDNGVTLISADGEAMLHIFAARNITGTTVGRYRRTLVNSRYAGVTLDHTPQSTTWFVLSGARGDKVFYEHVAFSCDGRSIYGWQMSYPASERTYYDLIADEVHRNSIGSARCGEAKKQTRKVPGANRARRL